jgi:hypothetical protein
VLRAGADTSAMLRLPDWHPPPDSSRRRPGSSRRRLLYRHSISSLPPPGVRILARHAGAVGEPALDPPAIITDAEQFAQLTAPPEWRVERPVGASNHHHPRGTPARSPCCYLPAGTPPGDVPPRADHRRTVGRVAESILVAHGRMGSRSSIALLGPRAARPRHSAAAWVAGEPPAVPIAPTMIGRAG